MKNFRKALLAFVVITVMALPSITINADVDCCSDYQIDLHVIHSDCCEDTNVDMYFSVQPFDMCFYCHVLGNGHQLRSFQAGGPFLAYTWPVDSYCEVYYIPVITQCICGCGTIVSRWYSRYREVRHTFRGVVCTTCGWYPGWGPW